MNAVTKIIMEFCAVDADEAWKIQLRMMENGVDFSECTDAELRSAIAEADAQLIRERSRS